MSEGREQIGRGTNGGDDVGRLIRQAGRRPAPDAEDLAAITAVARAAWEEKVHAGERGAAPGRSRRFLALAASLVLAVLAAWWWVDRAGEPVGGDLIATVELVDGSVMAGDGALIAGSRIGAGAEVTTGAGEYGAGRLSLRMAGGQSLRVDSATSLRLVSDRRVELLRGRIYIDSPPGTANAGGVDVETALGTVVEIGTQFEVSFDERAGELDVRVREGAVAVRRDEQSITARRGEALAVRRDGSVSRAESSTTPEQWGWVLDAAPAFDFNGKTLGVFLAWVEREMGVEVVFESEELEGALSSKTMSAPPDGLRPDQAFEVIVRGSELVSRIDEHGRAVLSRP